VVEDRIEESDTAIEEGYSLYHVASKANPPISVSVRVNGVSLLMEVDTGAPFPQSNLQRAGGAEESQLKPSNKVL
jgi:hypothetical protein